VSLLLVASFASRSAGSIPLCPACALTQLNSTFHSSRSMPITLFLIWSSMYVVCGFLAIIELFYCLCILGLFCLRSVVCIPMPLKLPSVRPHCWCTVHLAYTLVLFLGYHLRRQLFLTLLTLRSCYHLCKLRCSVCHHLVPRL